MKFIYLFMAVLLSNAALAQVSITSTPQQPQNFNAQILDSTTLRKIGNGNGVANAYIDRMPVILPAGKYTAIPLAITDSSTKQNMPNLWEKNNMKMQQTPILPYYRHRNSIIKKATNSKN